MTLYGAIKQLHELRAAEGMPIYYKPAIAEVINVLLTETEEVRHGKWINEGSACHCSACGRSGQSLGWNFCPWCGARMDGANE